MRVTVFVHERYGYSDVSPLSLSLWALREKPYSTLLSLSHKQNYSDPQHPLSFHFSTAPPSPPPLRALSKTPAGPLFCRVQFRRVIFCHSDHSACAMDSNLRQFFTCPVPSQHTTAHRTDYKKPPAAGVSGR